MQKNKKKLEWSREETNLLLQLQNQFASKKWKKISEIFQEHGFTRTQMECREKWINFLDPAINHNDWEEWELEKLYEVHEQVGTRWCLVQKFIGRTQNKIKNRFYGTLRNYIRFIVNHFESTDTCYNYQISKLSPKFLNQIYQAESQFKFVGEEIKNTIYSMRFRIQKNMLADRIRTTKTLYERLNILILKQFAQIDRVREVRIKKESTTEIKNQQSSIDNIEQTPIQQPQQQMNLHPPTICYPFLPWLSYQQNPFYWYI